MQSREQHQPPRPPVRRWTALLVLGLLAGLLGMHALAPGGIAPHHAHARPVPAAAAVDGDCADGHCGGSHAQHADTTCAAAAVGEAPQPPALTPDPTVRPAPTGAVRAHPAAAPDGGRAPPSLAELQLLRI
ncbi:DUF6153 family protein [Streptomyces sp. NPDC007264]|uniref:DUF6153 family protein n=1 Tax=Streptomyces sp. NPDC007264 TaxID=3364777 RepID=UPI0036DAFB35